jgi:hypothetical protein
MIHYHLNTQLFTTLWQSDPSPHLNLFLKNKKIQKVVGGPPSHIGNVVKSCIFRWH